MNVPDPVLIPGHTVKSMWIMAREEESIAQMLQEYHLVPVWLFMIFKHFLKIIIFCFWLCWSLLLHAGFL